MAKRKRTNILILHDLGFGMIAAENLLSRLTQDPHYSVRCQKIDWQTQFEHHWLVNTTHVCFLLHQEMSEYIKQVRFALRGTGIWMHHSFLYENVLFLGPHFKEELSGCYSCFKRRRLTHMAPRNFSSWERTIEKYMEINSDDRVPGFPPMFPIVAASHMYRVLESPERFRNSFSHITSVSHSIKSGVVMPLHGCMCRGTSSDDSRFHRYIVDTLNLGVR